MAERYIKLNLLCAFTDGRLLVDDGWSRQHANKVLPDGLRRQQGDERVVF